MPSVEPLSGVWLPKNPDFPLIRLEDYYHALTENPPEPWQALMEQPDEIRRTFRRLDEPSVMLHEHAFRIGQAHHFRVSLWLSYRFDDGVFRHQNHEQTFPEGVETYARLYRRMGFIPDGVFLLADMEYARVEHLYHQARKQAPLLDFRDRFGERHRFFLLPEEVWDGFALEPTLVVADGHHRMAASERLHQEGFDVRRPVALVSIRDPGLVILPTHRVLEGPLSDTLLARLSPWFSVMSHPEPVFSANKRELWFVTRKRSWRIQARPDLPHREFLPGRPEVYLRLETAMLHEVILPLLEESGVSYRWVDLGRDPRALWQSMIDEQFLVVLPPTLPGEVYAIARAGLTMPPKSTDFYPKLVAGVIWSPLKGRSGDQRI